MFKIWGWWELFDMFIKINFFYLKFKIKLYETWKISR